MVLKWFLSLFAVLLVPAGSLAAANVSCMECHAKSNPGLVADWGISTMAAAGLACTDCHGGSHVDMADTHQAVRPAIDACRKCHPEQAGGFSRGKHGLAEEALYISSMGKKVQTKAPAVFERSCATCHKEIGEGGGQCDACHRGHRFCAQEARKPEACLPCHMGNHPQYEAYSVSTHGALYRSRGLDGTVPTCSTCHLPEGDHMVKTSWGFMGVRGEEPDAAHRRNQEKVKTALTMMWM